METVQFGPDPGHEGASTPMDSLRGTCAEVNTQQVMSGTNDTNSNQHDAPVAHSWTQSLAPTPKGTGGGGNQIH